MVDRVKSHSLSRDVETDENTGIQYVHYGDIHTKVADKITSSSKLPFIKKGTYEYLKQGDVIIADASEDYKGIATPSVILEKGDSELVAGLHTIALRPFDMDSTYLYYLLNSESFKKHGYRVGTGMKVFGITFSNVLNYISYFPNIEEQRKIGAILLNIDDTIALQKIDYEIKNRITLSSIILFFGYILDKYLITLSLS